MKYAMIDNYWDLLIQSHWNHSFSLTETIASVPLSSADRLFAQHEAAPHAVQGWRREDHVSHKGFAMQNNNIQQ